MKTNSTHTSTPRTYPTPKDKSPTKEPSLRNLSKENPSTSVKEASIRAWIDDVNKGR